MITGKNYIGKKLSGKGCITHKTVNPKLNIENPTSFYEATTEELEEAVDLADKAFKEYKNTSGTDRAGFLGAIAEEILALDDTLIQMYCTETGLPDERAVGERDRTVFQIRAFADLVYKEDWRLNVIAKAHPDLRKTSIPLGSVVVFAASNFPLAFSTAGGDTASALAAGCPVIVKSHSMHSGTGELVASAIIKAIEKTGMPDGIFSNLTGRGRTVGQALVKHPKVKAVGFTGSIAGGRALYDLAAQRDEPIPVFTEMGSINPVVVTANAMSARSEEIASMFAGSITLGAGQFCTKPGLILTLEGEKTQFFIEDLAQKIVDIGSRCMLHPSIKQGFIENGNLVSSQKGVSVVRKIEGEIDTNFAASQINTVSGNDFLKNPKMQTEVFGPFSLIVVCSDMNELIAAIESLDGQLTGTVIAEKSDYGTLHRIVDALQSRVGRIVFNAVPTGVMVSEAMTHGGPYPASSDSRFTSVGLEAIKRWVRPFTYQNFPTELLPLSLKH